MAYVLNAFVAKEKALQVISEEFEQATLVRLPQGFGLVPIVWSLRHEISQVVKPVLVDSFNYLSMSMESCISLLEFSGQIAYVESEFFGGDGGH